MNTAAEYRAEIERIKSAVAEVGPQAVRAGHVSQDEFQNFANAVGVEQPEDEETRQAREELEAFTLRVQQATRTFLPNGSRDEALRRLGVAVPEGRVGRLPNA